MLRTHGAPWLRTLPRGQRDARLLTLCRGHRAPPAPHRRQLSSRPRHGAHVCRSVAQQVRGKKTKTVVNLEDLPQGALPKDPLLPDQDSSSEPAYPTVVLQARRNMQKFDNCVLLTRVGGFYELYFEHADEFGPLLNLKVASKKTSAGPVPMVR